MPIRRIELDYAPRWLLVPYHERTQRWACLVCHRRFGKTVGVLNDQIRRGITLNRPDIRMGYIAPYRGQAKEVAWNYLKKFSMPLWGKEPSESELSVTLLNGARLRLYGGDNPDAIRGGYFDDVVMDEMADQRPGLWANVVRPMLADRNGSATFIGSSKGKNEFYDLHRKAQQDPQNWYSLLMRASESGIIPQAELDAMLLEMGADRYMQEMECSFDAAIQGAFYAEELKRAGDQGRIRPLFADRALRVHTAWDLGFQDSTAIWFIQCLGTERRIIDYYETSGVALDHYVQVLEEKKRSKSNPDGYLYGNHYFPHDIAVHELTTGQSRRDTLEGLGIEVTVVPQHAPLDGINAVRRMLDRSFIDPLRCERGYEAIKNYRREYDERLKDWKTKPLHDWSSHGADALRTFVVGHDEPDLPRQEDRHRRNRETPQSAWAV
ncbi:MAG TPA: hypothetical protein VEU47_13480 [Candidatus Cybelea sp.]|nr:hypothetical protein [Candidatus Cybelea sp.]